MKKAEPHILTIFGASGDLTARKLMPAVFNLFEQKLLPENFAILGLGRTPMSDTIFRDKIYNSISEHAENKVDIKRVAEFVKLIYYTSIDTSKESDYSVLQARLEELSEKHNTYSNIIFYLATPPSLYRPVVDNLCKSKLSDDTNGCRRVIVEKPFGYDYQGAKDLNTFMLNCLKEDQLYRIDHYLGKETVQNIMVTRFTNGIFEPLWNRNYIDRVEITSAESIGVGGRGGYYDGSGAMRDMIQNHLLQLMALVAMEPPAVIESNAIRNETLKVLQSIRKYKSTEDVQENVIRGQYVASKVKGEYKEGYRNEKGVHDDSKTETFVAMKFFIDNWRWSNVPFFIRTGKSLPTRVTEVVIHFKKTPHQLFSSKYAVAESNQLIIRIQPDEGVLLKFGMKVPGSGFDVKTVNMDFHYSDLTDEYIPTAYERLLYDCMIGDSTLYSRGDSVEATWAFIQPVLDAWKNNPDIPVYGYPVGTWGPENADNLIGNGKSWRYPCKNLADDGVYCEL